MLAVCAATLACGFLLKAQCRAGFDGRQYERLCYNDLQPLFHGREIDRGTFPYLDGRLEGERLADGAIEYPVLTGLFMWASGRLVSSAKAYFEVSALLLAPFGLLVAFLLARLTAWRALLWSGAPALVLYAFHNWDLLVVAASLLAVWSWKRGNTGAAGAWLGVGGALKLYPLMFVAPLAAEAGTRGDRYGALRGAVAGVTTFGLINLPFALAAGEGWVATFRFHALRDADYNSFWHWAFPSQVGPLSLPSLDVSILNLLTAGLTAATLALCLFVAARRRRRDQAFPFLATSAAMLAGFLLWNKVHSPQYALWLLPFFALTSIPVVWWAAYSLADLVVYAGIFRWFYDVSYRHLDFTVAKSVLITGVWARTLLLLVLIGAFLRSKDVIRATAKEAGLGAQGNPVGAWS